MYHHLKTKSSTDKLSPNQYVKDGSKFVGWAFSENSDQPVYYDQSTVTFHEDMDLYAVWKKTYVITFNVNGGYYKNRKQQKDLQRTVVSGEPIIIPTCSAVKQDYKFIGWSLNSTSNEAQYCPGQIINPVSNMTLHAIWQHV